MRDVTDEELGAALRALLSLNTGADVDYFTLLTIRQLENGNYSSESLDHEGNGLALVDDVSLDEALAFFLRVRKERKLGYDIEARLYRESVKR